jgi:hypothetical protein
MTQLYHKTKNGDFVPADLGFFETGRLPVGHYLLTVEKGGQSLMSNVDPAFAPLIAATMAARSKVVDAVSKAGEARLSNGQKLITPEEKEAWETFIAKTGFKYLEYPSCSEITDTTLAALVYESSAFIEKNPTIKAAYEEFLLLCQMARHSR